MKKPVIYIVDVFAYEKYTGNQLAVVVNGERIPDSEKQKIAREMNYSETTFIVSGKQTDNGYDVRIFTPRGEIPFAGHPALGTAFIIQREIIKKPVKKVKLNLRSGQIPVAFKYSGSNEPGLLWMKQNEPEFMNEFPPPVLAPLLNIDEKDIDARFPVQEVSTGLPFIIVPLRDLSAVKKAKIALPLYYEFIKEKKARAIFIFSSQTYSDENNLNARMFADYYGISEDPATGSANGCLAGYLLKHNYFETENIHMRVEQGYEIERPSLVFIRAEERDRRIEVHVGGRVIPVAKGELA